MTFWTSGMMMATGGGPALPVRVASSAQIASNGDTLTVNKPTGTLPGHFMVAFVWGNSMPEMSLTGWTRVFSDTVSTLGLAVFTKTAGGSEPSSYSFDGTVGARACVIVTYRGGTGSVDVQSTGTNVNTNTTSTALSITPTKTGLLLASFGIRSSATVSSAPSGMNYVNGIVGAVGVSMVLYELSPSSAGATGNKSLTWSGTNQSGGWMAQIY